MIPARSVGAIASPLIQMLERGHHKVKLSQEDWLRLVTWIKENVGKRDEPARWISRRYPVSIARR